MALATPSNAVASTVLTAAFWNAQVRDQFNQLLAAPTAYTPTWTSSGTAPVLGNGTLVGEYWTIGNKFVRVVITLTLGSTSTAGTGSYALSLPSTPGLPAAGHKLLQGNYFDVSAAANYPILGLANGTASIALVSNAYPVASVTAATPVAPAVGDIYHFDVEYRLA